jgi:hypothetical protein
MRVRVYVFDRMVCKRERGRERRERKCRSVTWVLE